MIRWFTFTKRYMVHYNFKYTNGEIGEGNLLGSSGSILIGPLDVAKTLEKDSGEIPTVVIRNYIFLTRNEYQEMSKQMEGMRTRVNLFKS